MYYDIELFCYNDIANENHEREKQIYINIYILNIIMNKGFIKIDNNSVLLPTNLPSTNHILLVLLHTRVQSLFQKSKGRLYSVGVDCMALKTI